MKGEDRRRGLPVNRDINAIETRAEVMISGNFITRGLKTALLINYQTFPGLKIAL